MTIKEQRRVTTTLNLGAVGAAVAVVLSWSTNHSVWWAILHGMLNWYYVIYWVLEYGEK